jgi:hypothetical protein
MDFEQIEVKNGMVYLYDEDGFVTINMLLEDVKKIMKHLNPYVLNEESYTAMFNIEGDQPIDINLKFYDDGEFTIESRIWDISECHSSYYHGFNFEGAMIEDWIEVYDFINTYEN